MISVITPVYNAEKYLSKNIESVLKQKNVSEHILIDDGSTDNSWQIILEYSTVDSRIIPIQHPDKKNHGRSKTRNLGIRKANNNLIAFLDADDYYLDQRFEKDLLLLQDHDVDGVYNAIGVHFYDSYKGNKNIRHVLTTVRERIHPKELFENMGPIGPKGWFSGDGLIIKKSCLLNVGLFNENLTVAEDTELWVKLSLKYNLIAGELSDPVAIRGVHDNNVFNKRDVYLKANGMMYKSLLIWSVKNKVAQNRIELIIKKYEKHLYLVFSNQFLGFNKYWFHTLFFAPSLIFYKNFVIIYIKYIKRFIVSKIL